MQAWQIAALVAAVVLPALGIINALLLNQVRVELSGVRIQMLEARVADNKEVHAWVEAGYASKETAKATADSLSLRIRALELRRTN